jgi:hypothetical protein
LAGFAPLSSGKGVLAVKKGNIMKTNELEKMERRPYADQGYAYYDRLTDTWYNDFGQELRDPEEYLQYYEGYMPFGDE